ECVAQALWFGPAKLHTLALALPLEARGNLVIHSAIRARRDVKAGRAESHDVDVARASHGAKKVQVVNGLEQIRLPLAVVADDHDAGLRKGEIEPGQVAKVPQRERSQYDA